MRASALRDHAAFLAGFLRAPWRVGAIAPSSQALADVMTDDMGLESARTVVELGPGTGVFTRAIGERVGGEALVMAVEIDPRMVALLTPRFPRVRVVNDSAERLDRLLAACGRKEADAILSGLPWASFPADLQSRLLAAVVAGLRPGGRFATFAYSHAAWLPAGRRFRALLSHSFAAVETTRVVWGNLPPAFVYRCRR
jgi:phosphatidylethanolamine/phosphatidyl-N-methylethanolamine N-methyltransferase